ncbi:MAG: hypothetical protein WD002_03780 [Pseudomonadales bacterium]
MKSVRVIGTTLILTLTACEGATQLECSGAVQEAQRLTSKLEELMEASGDYEKKFDELNLIKPALQDAIDLSTACSLREASNGVHFEIATRFTHVHSLIEEGPTSHERFQEHEQAEFVDYLVETRDVLSKSE